jgi:hypothetical protein
MLNKEVVTFNRRLQKIAKSFNHVEIVNMSSKREHFTRHGLHMNGSGKDWITSLLMTKILETFTTYTPKPPITLTWKVDINEGKTEERRVEEGRNSSSQESGFNSELVGNNNQCKANSVSDLVISIGS